MTSKGPDPSPGNVLVVDDHPLFCDALTLTLQSMGEFDSVYTAGTLEEALDVLAREAGVTLVVLDLNLPDVNGLEGLVRLRNAVPGVAVLVVSSMADNATVARTLKAGADGFVPKHAQRDMFRRALAAVTGGTRFVPDGFIAPDEAGGGEADAALVRLAALTNQQARILHLICEGKLNKQIAYDLNIAETTVKAHVTAIMRKLGVHSRTQAVLVAQEARFHPDAVAENGKDLSSTR